MRGLGVAGRCSSSSRCSRSLARGHQSRRARRRTSSSPPSTTRALTAPPTRTRSSACSATTAARSATTPASALRKAILLRQLDQRRGRAGHAAGHRRQPGGRRASCSSIQVYCPDELEDFQEYVDDLKSRRRDGLRRHGPRGAGRRADAAGPRRAGRAGGDPVGRRPAAVSRRRSAPGPPSGSLDAFRRVGFADVGLHETADGSKAVVGSRPCGDPDAPTVLLYAHYDVQPPLDDDAWRTPPFELTEVDGRWFGRGAADCKGNIVMHLTALRALGRRRAGQPQAGRRGVRGAGHRRARGLRAEERRPAARGRDPRVRHRQRRRRRTRRSR